MRIVGQKFKIPLLKKDWKKAFHYEKPLDQIGDLMLKE